MAGTTRKGTPLPYGAWSLEAMDAHGGWLASAVDLVRFACTFDDPVTCKILAARSIATMFARPALTGAPAEAPNAPYYACCWHVRASGRPGQINAWHTGSLDGTSTLLVRRHDGKNWAVLFNARTAPDGKCFSDKIDPLLHQAVDAVRRWPTARDVSVWTLSRRRVEAPVSRAVAQPRTLGKGRGAAGPGAMRARPSPRAG